MAVSGNLQNTGGVKLGTTHQHQGSGDGMVSIYGWVKSDVVENATSITITIDAAMWYGGYNNYVPWEVGVYKVPKGATSINDFDNTGLYVQGRKDQTLTMYDGNRNWVWWQFGEQSFTIEKTSEEFGLIPYMKVGSINYWSDRGDLGSGDYHIYSNYYGILCMYSVENNAYHKKMTYHSVELDAFHLLGGITDTTTASYSNCPIIVRPAGGLFVANSSGVYKRASKIYVYNSAGVPKLATSITVYDASGVGHTMSC